MQPLVFYAVRETAHDADGNVTNVDIVAGPYAHNTEGELEAREACAVLSRRHPGEYFRVIATARVELRADGERMPS